MASPLIPYHLYMQQSASYNCLEVIKKDNFLAATGIVLGYSVFLYICFLI